MKLALEQLDTLSDEAVLELVDTVGRCRFTPG